MISPQEAAALCADDYKLPADFKAEGLHVRFTVADDTLAISLRGSKSLQDWLDNLKVWSAPDWVARDHPKLGRVCAGFADDVITAYPAIRAALFERDWKRIAVQGHSRGGAQGQVLVALMLADGLPVAQLMTFGAPRVCGRLGLPELIAELPGADFVNGNDPVPYQPPFFRAARQTAKRFIGARRTLCLNVADHFMPAYQASLADAAA